MFRDSFVIRQYRSALGCRARIRRGQLEIYDGLVEHDWVVHCTREKALQQAKKWILQREAFRKARRRR